MNYEEDRAVSDAIMPKVLNILGSVLGERPTPAPDVADMTENTDLMVGPVKVAVRVRSDEYRHKYRHQVTFRYDRPSGQDTEIDKIRKGYGDINFYAFSDGENITAWVLIDLDVFREKMKKSGDAGWDYRSNFNGDSRFVAVDMDQWMWSDCVLARSDNW